VSGLSRCRLGGESSVRDPFQGLLSNLLPGNGCSRSSTRRFSTLAGNPITLLPTARRSADRQTGDSPQCPCLHAAIGQGAHRSHNAPDA